MARFFGYNVVQRNPLGYCQACAMADTATQPTRPPAPHAPAWPPLACSHHGRRVEDVGALDVFQCNGRQAWRASTAGGKARRSVHAAWVAPVTSRQIEGGCAPGSKLVPTWRSDTPADDNCHAPRTSANMLVAICCNDWVCAESRKNRQSLRALHTQSLGDGATFMSTATADLAHDRKRLLTTSCNPCRPVCLSRTAVPPARPTSSPLRPGHPAPPPAMPALARSTSSRARSPTTPMSPRPGRPRARWRCPSAAYRGERLRAKRPPLGGYWCVLGPCAPIMRATIQSNVRLLPHPPPDRHPGRPPPTPHPHDAHGPWTNKKTLFTPLWCVTRKTTPPCAAQESLAGSPGNKEGNAFSTIPTPTHEAGKCPCAAFGRNARHSLVGGPHAGAH